MFVKPHGMLESSHYPPRPPIQNIQKSLNISSESEYINDRILNIHEFSSLNYKIF